MLRDPPVRVRALPLLLVAGCSFDGAGVPLEGGGDGGDGTIDARTTDAAPLIDGFPAFDPSNLDDLTPLDGVSGSLILTAGNWTLDTDAATLRDPGNASVPDLAWSVVGAAPEIQVLAVGRLDVVAAATLRVTGTRALLILADGPIIVDGTIALAVGCETSSTEDRDRLWCGGPGGGDGGHPNPDDDSRIAATGCAPGGDGDAGLFTDEHGGGGGGHGSLGAPGGGFDGNGGDSGGGAACGSIALEPLQGGSGGGGAGYVNGNDDDGRTAGGGGGGALQLTSTDEIVVRGTIDAPGGGGAGTAQVLGTANAGTDGGGGGGAGGAILLEAWRVEIGATAIVTANGGGGGAGVTLDQPGERGQRARVRALGGVNADLSSGGLGAIGDVDGDEATAGAAPGDGGSGGGGGAGRVHVHTAMFVLDPSAVVSPVASDAPLFGF